jgi:hypothetical protein
MTGFDFFIDLAVTGTVLGLDHTSTPEAVHAVFRYDRPRRQKKFRAYAEHLLPLSTGERERWYAKRNPRLSAALSEWATVKPLLLAEQGN